MIKPYYFMVKRFRDFLSKLPITYSNFLLKTTVNASIQISAQYDRTITDNLFSQCTIFVTHQDNRRLN